MPRRTYSILRRPILKAKNAKRLEDRLDHVTKRVADARRQREQLRQVNSANQPDIKPSDTATAYRPARPGYLPVILILIAVALLGWAFIGQQGTDSDTPVAELPKPDALNGVATDWLEARIDSLDQKLEFVSGQISELESRLATTDTLQAQIAVLNEDIERLNSVAALGTPESSTKQGSATDQLAQPRPAESVPQAPATADMPGAGPGQAARGSANAAPAQKTPNSEDSKLSVQKLYEKDGESSIATGDDSWKINLISSPSREDAMHFANKAKSRGVITEVEQVSVRGTRYWRVQISGFATYDEALEHSNSIKTSLGLRDTWIYSN